MVDKLRRLPQAHPALDECRIGYRYQACVEKRPVGKLGLKGRLAVDHPDVDVLGVKIPAAVTGAKAQAELRIGGLEPVQAGKEPARGDGDIDLQGQLGRTAALAQIRRGIADPGEGVTEHGKQRRPRVGEFDPPALAPEQRPAQLALQLLHLVADRRVGDAQLVAGFAEAQMPRRRLERPQGREGGQAGFRAHEVAHSGSRVRPGSAWIASGPPQTGKPAARIDLTSRSRSAGLVAWPLTQVSMVKPGFCARARRTACLAVSSWPNAPSVAAR